MNYPSETVAYAGQDRQQTISSNIEDRINTVEANFLDTLAALTFEIDRLDGPAPSQLVKNGEQQATPPQPSGTIPRISNGVERLILINERLREQINRLRNI